MVLLAVIVLSFFVSSQSEAIATNEQNRTIRLQIGSYTMRVDGRTETIDSPPVLINETTLVPLRAIAENLGLFVNWRDGVTTLTTNDVMLQLRVGQRDVLIERRVGIRGNWETETVTLPVAPALINNRTMVPLRFISEQFGAEVEWIASTQEIVITAEAVGEWQVPTRTVELTAGSRTMYIDGYPQTLSVAPILHQGSTRPSWRKCGKRLGSRRQQLFPE